jgi:DNA-binding response OmpR family regulator
MTDQRSRSTPRVLVITKHEKFAATACQQLEQCDFEVRVLSPEGALRDIRPEDGGAAAALIDYDAKSPDGSALYVALRTALSNCAILLVCTLDEASAAAQAALSSKAFDYLLTTSVHDPNRLPLVIDRASANTRQRHHEQELQCQQILRSLAALREILTIENESVVKNVLDKFRFPEGANSAAADLLEDPTRGYEHCLVELICGRLRRLENQVLLLEKGRGGGLARSTRQRILVVEDDDTCAELLGSVLERSGFEVVVAATAFAAKEAMNERHPDLVLMDVHLGDWNGIDLVKALRANGMPADVPIIIVTSDRKRATLRNAIGVNVQGYILKPYEPGFLVSKVRAVLERSHDEAVAAAAPGPENAP